MKQPRVGHYRSTEHYASDLCLCQPCTYFLYRTKIAISDYRDCHRFSDACDLVPVAKPEYPCSLVRPCTARAQIPVSSRMRAVWIALMEEASQPRRILAVTGTGSSACTTREATRSRRGQSRRRAEPPWRQTTLLTGQPKFRSMKSGCTQSTTALAASAIFSGSAPKSWTPIGRSSGRNDTISRVRWFRWRIPSAETNSVTTTSAPYSLHNRRKTESVTPAIGAR